MPTPSQILNAAAATATALLPNNGTTPQSPGSQGNLNVVIAMVALSASFILIALPLALFCQKRHASLFFGQRENYDEIISNNAAEQEQNSTIENNNV